MTSSAFPIVGVGASAGGLEAFHAFFAHMPADCNMAFVMVLHLPADRKSMLPEILSRWTVMPVKEGTDGTRVEPNCVYVPPPHALVTLVDGCLSVRTAAEEERVYRPIDGFFDALASSLGEDAIGVVLSGTGSDGALGLKAIKEAGGLTVVQGTDGTAPQYDDMPAGAIATGAVDLVAPVQEIPKHLLRLRGSRAASLPLAAGPPSTDAARFEICAILRGQLGHDFSGYRDKTFLRRVQRRMQMVGVATLDGYIARLRTDRDEVVQLFRDLLIRVTSFFRDKETFEVLERKVIPRLFEGKGADGRVRVWIPGCATGEEAYSLAILLREHMDTRSATPKVQLFATDIDESSIGTARLGRYPKTLLEGLSEERRARYFTLSQGSYVVSKEIRDLCTFSPHNVVHDPPFSRMDMVSCRNLLIYMDKDLQATVIPVFHYALVKGGILLLGGSESASQHADLFEPIDKAARIFVRRNVRSPALRLEMQPHHAIAQFDSVGLPHSIPGRRTRTSEEQYSSPDRSQSLSNESAQAAERTRSTGARSKSSGWRRLLARWLPAEPSDLQLVHDLLSAQEQLQALREEHQTALEELRSSNEELHSVNEEMQSTNEELETSKEELQSLNEELQTANVQLNDKVDELDAANSDLRNLFESTEIATIFLDRHLIVRSFTPAIATLYNLIPSDQGRPITDIVNRLQYTQLPEDVAQVLSTLQPLERRISRADRVTHYIMRILPYREPDSTVSGVLVTFIDITSIVQAEAALVEADVRKDEFMATLARELRNPLAPIRSAARLLQDSDLDAPQARAQAIISRQVAKMSSLLDDLLDVSRITRGSFLLKKEYVDIKDAMDAVVVAIQPMVDAKNHTLRVDWPLQRTVLEVDRLRLIQILSNLAANAVKFTPPGGLVGFGCRLDSQSVIFFVRDSGAGLAPDMLTRVFTMFTRVEPDPGDPDGGLGIGLALAKGLVELHGGSIAARSAGLGKGSEFVVSLPRSLIVEDPVQRDAAAIGADPSSKRILIADDNRDAAETLGLYLDMQGHETHFAHGGGEALAVAAAVKPEVGIIDIGMPDMSGYEVAQRIRHEAWGEQMTLIALTGWGQDDDIRRAFAAGFDHHCTKPVDPAELELLFARGRR